MRKHQNYFGDKDRLAIADGLLEKYYKIIRILLENLF